MRMRTKNTIIKNEPMVFACELPYSKQFGNSLFYQILVIYVFRYFFHALLVAYRSDPLIISL